MHAMDNENQKKRPDTDEESVKQQDAMRAAAD